MLFFPPSPLPPRSVTAIEWVQRRDSKKKRKIIEPEGSQRPYTALTAQPRQDSPDPQLRGLHRQLLEVCKQDADYDEDFRQPTQQSFDAALHLVRGAAKRVRGALPNAWVCADGEGGLSIEWRREDHVVVFLVPPSSLYSPRIYHTVDKVGVLKSVAEATPLALSEAITWLTRTK